MSGIFKVALAGPVAIGPLGLAGDQQADRRVHGGPEKAVHHFPAEHYDRLAARFPALAGALTPGSLGENVSTTGWDETTVCPGDVFALGTARVQVSQPRSPCWKIDHRYGLAGVARHIGEAGISGWYYRVLAPGVAAPGDPFLLVERTPGAPTLAALAALWRAHRPEPQALLVLAAAAPGLSPDWRRKLHERAAWLRANPDSTSAPTLFHVKPPG